MASTRRLAELTKLRIDRTSPEPPTVKRLWRPVWIIAVALLVCGAAGLAAWVYYRNIPEVQTVRAKTITSSATMPALAATGYIVAHHKIDVNSKVTGRVKWIGVEKGDRVRAGQVLVELEDDEFRAQVQQSGGQVQAARAYLQELETGSRTQEIDQALSNLEQARATLRDDRVTLERTRMLAQQGVVARQQLDDAEARYDSDASRVNSLTQAYALTKIGPRQEEILRARGNLIQAQGQLAYAEAQLAATKIRAPVDGTILERTAEVGELITSTFASTAAGGPIGSVVSLANLKDLQVELDIAQNDFAKLHPSQHAVVTTDAYPDRKYDGELAEVAPEANRQKATVQVKVQIQSPDEFLRPDMNATVLFTSNSPAKQEKTTGVLVPQNAIQSDQHGHWVLVANDGRAVTREVHEIQNRSDGVVVSGLMGGENVIVAASSPVTNGSRIRQKTATAF